MNYKRHFTTSNSKLGRCGVTGKVIFRTENAAKKRIKEILSEETNRCHDYLRAFHCFRCGFWHLTSKPNEHFFKRQEHGNRMAQVAKTQELNLKELEETAFYEDTQTGNNPTA